MFLILLDENNFSNISESDCSSSLYESYNYEINSNLLYKKYIVNNKKFINQESDCLNEIIDRRNTNVINDLKIELLDIILDEKSNKLSDTTLKHLYQRKTEYLNSFTTPKQLEKSTIISEEINKEKSILLTESKGNYHVLNKNISKDLILKKKEFDLITKTCSTAKESIQKSMIITTLSGAKNRMKISSFRVLFLLNMSDKILFQKFKSINNQNYELLQKIDSLFFYIENPKSKRILNFKNNSSVNSLAIEMSTNLHGIIKEILNIDGNILIEIYGDEILLKKIQNKNY